MEPIGEIILPAMQSFALSLLPTLAGMNYTFKIFMFVLPFSVKALKQS